MRIRKQFFEDMGVIDYGKLITYCRVGRCVNHLVLDGNFFCHRHLTQYNQWANENPPKGRKLLMNIREKITQLTKSHEDRMFEKHGITSDHGNLTDLGRRVVLDRIFRDNKDLRAAILSDVEAVEKEETKK